ncbi:MAG: hypothetical protein KatS3mg110_0904 [Pirellulaceae bacterium]|nr:MAG: hypothetical protein KatS3mg110_0904 [Pirellulaceae bacterium]
MISRSVPARSQLSSNLDFLMLCLVIVSGLVVDRSAGQQRSEPSATAGPLRIHPQNPRYFADSTGKAVYLIGSHTWNNLVDMGRSHPPEAFDFEAYLDFLQKHHHNFIRLWTWGSTRWDTRANGRWGKPDFIHWAGPLPWARTGPGLARDGLPRFDLTRFDEAYFHRLRSRVEAAQKRGIYVSVMLFEGWALYHAYRRPEANVGWGWESHPFHPANNIQGINADSNGDGNGVEFYSLTDPKITALQESYIRKVVDTVHDLDNVLFEVINEGGEPNWNAWVVRTVQEYERTLGKQHPVGLTGHGGQDLPGMMRTSCQWVSPGRRDGYGDDPPAWNGDRPSLLDTDHVYGIGGSVGWVWKAFTRGHNPLFMDPYDGSVLGSNEPRWEAIRQALGTTRRLAERLDMARMQPLDRLSSTGYCLADPERAFVVFVPDGNEVVLDLKDSAGSWRVEWWEPTQGQLSVEPPVGGGQQRRWTLPREAPLVLLLLRELP